MPGFSLLEVVTFIRPSEVAVRGYGANGETNLPVVLTNIIAVSAGAPSVYGGSALDGNGTAHVWPSNYMPFYAGGETNLIGIAAGAFGVRANGQVTVWPAAPGGVESGVSNAVALCAFGNNFLVLKTDGTVISIAVPPPSGLTNVSLSRRVICTAWHSRSTVLSLPGVTTPMARQRCHLG